MLPLLCSACGRSGLELPLEPSSSDGGGATATASSGADDVTVGATGVGGATSSAASGAGGTGATGMGGEGPGPPNPVECITCVAENCPEVLDCVQDPVCGQGLACVVLECGIGGSPDLECLAGCFDGDIGAALDAIEVLTCIIGTCGDDCAALLPGG